MNKVEKFIDEAEVKYDAEVEEIFSDDVDLGIEVEIENNFIDEAEMAYDVESECEVDEKKKKKIKEEVPDLLEVIPDVENKESNFILQNQKVFLTYKTHIDKKEFVKFISKLIKKNPKFIRIAHENGRNDPITPYEHSHALIDFGKRFQSKKTNILDFNGIHPNIKKVIGSACWYNCKNYLSKEDPECIDLKSVDTETVLNNLGSCKNEREAILGALKNEKTVNWSHINGIKTAYEIMKDRGETHYEEPSFEWQIDLVEELKGKPNNRKIIWYVDKIGRSGKSQLARYLQITEENKYLCTKDLGTERDAATVITGAINKGWTGHGLILDLPRSAEKDKKRIYAYIESIKDGHVTATKYEGGNTFFDIPHLVVFSNWEPNVMMLSLDRWDIRYIEEDKKVRKRNSRDIIPDIQLYRREQIAEKLSQFEVWEIKEILEITKRYKQKQN